MKPMRLSKGQRMLRGFARGLSVLAGPVTQPVHAWVAGGAEEEEKKKKEEEEEEEPPPASDKNRNQNFRASHMHAASA